MLPDGLIRPARDWALCIIEPSADPGCFTFRYHLHGYEEEVELCGASAAVRLPPLNEAITALQEQGWRLVNYEMNGVLAFEPQARGAAN